MSELVLTLGVPHTPLLWRMMVDPVPDDLRRIQEMYRRFAGMLRAAEPDVIVFVATDHFRQLTTANMPAFMVGRAPRMRGTHPNEQRSFGLPFSEVPGDVATAAAILGERTLPEGIDFSFSDEPWLDHAFMVPLLYLTPDLDVPVVPIYTNTNAPPIPAPSRFLRLGEHLRSVIEDGQHGRRVAVVVTGHLSYELGGPRQFGGGAIHPGFDQEAVGWFRDGDVAAAVKGASVERLAEAGNLTSQFSNFLTLLSLNDGPAHVAKGAVCRFGTEPFFAWVGS